MRRSVLVICGCVAVLPLVLSGCDSMRRSVGLEKVVPNEFDVVENAPLAIPPDFALRPPRPGAGPTQGLTPTAQAKETIFRAGGNNGSIAGSDANMSPGETDILRAAGAQSAPGDIRATINQEAAESQPFNKTFVDELVFWRSQKVDNKGLLDPVKETARLEDKSGGVASQAAAAKQFSAPPTIDRKSDSSSFLDRIF